MGLTAVTDREARMSRLIRMDHTGHTELARWSPDDPQAVEAAVAAFRAELDRGYYGMVSQGFPQLVRVSADILRPDPTRTFPERTPIISQVRMINEAPWIPDLERIEEMISEETSVLAE